MNRLQHAHGHPARTYPGRWRGTDPESNSKMPDPDDPESNTKMPDPDDPESNSKMPDPDDPNQYHLPAHGPGGCGVVLAPSCSCCCQAASGEETGPRSWVRPRDYSGFVIVRMARGVEHPCARSLWKLARKLGLEGLRAVLKLPGSPAHLISRPLLDFEPDRALELEKIRGLEKRAAKSAFPPRHSLTLYWRLDLRKRPRMVEKIVERLNGLAEVDLAYRELAAVDSQTAAFDGQDFAEDQGYLAAAPMGIGAAHLSLPSSQNVTLCDVEQGWIKNHLDLPAPALEIGDNRVEAEAGAGNHGAAVLGPIVAPGTSQTGIKGAAGGLVQHIQASHWKEGGKFPKTNGHVAEAIARALLTQKFSAGDILLLEVQRGLLPTEVDEADFDAIRLATALGITVIEAAGNGGFDLDRYSDPDIGRSLRRGAPDFRDSGAILVGASRAALPHDRAPFSNHGSRLDCFAWGEAVTTCGYGDLAGTVDTDSYTNSFSGTSSAAAIIASAAALLQTLHDANTGTRLGPQAMRALLADPATGTRQGPNVPGHIGVMPDLEAIVRDRLQLVPDVYLRRSIDEGSEISSSPDILIWAGSGGSTPDAQFGEGSGRENLPAPGDTLKTGQNDVYVRLRNRGLGAEPMDVQLFAGPVATIITPEEWTPIGKLSGVAPQGDTLHVAGPVSAALTSPLGSLLAVVVPPGGSLPLPPGPPYFDWEEYLAFLRQPGVAWRNAYRISETSPSIPTFFIAGTPDRTRRFDLEVIQRLPASAKVSLQLPGALAAKLQQRQPWLKSGGTLPERPRTAIRGVQLAAGARAAATFTVTGAPLGRGHSLAIRQLWRGVEVGRITWFFGLDP